MTMNETPPPDGPSDDDEARVETARGPAQWVPKGALSRFLLQGAAWAFVAQMLALVGGFSSQVLLARLLSPEGLGIYFLTQSIVIVVANVGEFGLTRPLSRLISTDLGSGRSGHALRALRSAISIAAVSGVFVVVVFGIGGGDWLATSVFDSPLMAGGIGLVTLWIGSRMILNIGSGAIQGMHRVGLAAFLHGALIPTTLALVCAGLLWTGTSVDYDSIIAICAVTTIVGAGLAVFVVWLPFAGVRPDGPPRTRVLFASTLPIFGAGILQVASVQADLWIIGSLLTSSDVALYGAAKRLTILIAFPLSILAFVVPPLISDLYARGERTRLERLVRASTTAASLPAVVAFVIFMLFGTEILTLAYGEIYAEGSVLLYILVAERIFFLMLGPGSLVLVMTGHERVVFRITMVSATVSLLALYFGGRFGGVQGVAIAYAFASGATGFWYLIAARLHTGMWVHATPFALKPIAEVIQRFRARGSSE